MEIPINTVISENAFRQERQWIEAAKQNPAEFEVIYNRYYEMIFRFIYQRLDSKDIAFDITQQVFILAMVNIKKYEDRGVPFSSWLYRIAKNELNQLFRKNQSFRTVNIDDTNIRYLADEMKTEGLEKYSERLTQILTELDEDDLQLIEMRYFEKRPFKEIAEILEITENNAKVRIYRVLDKMRERILNK